jgi:hypothetical protein
VKHYVVQEIGQPYGAVQWVLLGVDPETDPSSGKNGEWPNVRKMWHWKGEEWGGSQNCWALLFHFGQFQMV